ncbi:MAG: F0F1 ATP synthase subunit B [Patescibacteria group bacterium]
MELFQKLGIDWRLLLAQAINFLVLLLILSKFLFKPVIKMLDERSSKVKDSLKQAEDIKRQVELINKENEKKILASKTQAETIIRNAQAEAEKERQQIIAKSRAESSQIIVAAKKQLAQEKQQIITEAKTEIGSLVVSATEKILQEKLDPQKDWTLIEQVIKKVI